jgi:hypothetical protein
MESGVLIMKMLDFIPFKNVYKCLISDFQNIENQYAYAPTTTNSGKDVKVKVDFSTPMII